MQQIPDEQIEKFLQGRSSPEEAAAVAEYLRQYPEHPLLWQEWEQTDGVTALPDNVSARMQAHLHAHTRRRGRVVRHIGRVAAAASLIAALGLGYQWYIKQRARMVIVRETDSFQPAPMQWAGLVNHHARPLSYTLPDSSIVVLYPGAYIRYPLHMGHWYERSNGRDIFLEGKAQFKVSKNASLPFTAYAKGIAITALGTTFTVTSQRENPQVRVQLLEGKVVVYSKGGHPKLKDIYLLPGQECMVDKQFNTAQVSRSADNKAVTVQYTKPATPEKSALQPLQFSRARLAQVLDSIGQRYGVKIVYSQAGIDQLSFTGTFLPTDDLETTINVICNIDDLTYEWQGNNIIINKQH